MGLDPANTVVIEITEGDFPGGPVVKTPHFQCRDAGGAGVIPGRGTNIPHAARCSQKKKKKSLKTLSGKMPEHFFHLSIHLSHIEEMFHVCQPGDTYGGRSVILANSHTWKGEGLRGDPWL